MKTKMNNSIAKFVVLANSGVDSLRNTLGGIQAGDIVNILQDLLMDEYRQRSTYEHYRYLMFGPMAIGVKEHLEEHFHDEIEHIDVLQRYIVSLGAIPTLERHPIPTTQENNLRGIMQLNFELEQATVEKYSMVVKAMSELNSSAHVALINDLETITSSEAEHVQDLARWLKEIF